MPTLGEELKRRREERHISLNEISESTRIGVRFLKAIDTDNYSILPGGIFTRSFIRAYAKHVGMNEDEAIMLYNEQIGGAKPETNNLSEVAQQIDAIATKKASRQEQKQAAKRALPIPQTVQQPDFQAPPLTVRKTSTQVNWGTLVIGVGILIVIAVIVTALVRQLNKASAEKQASNTPVIKVEPPQPENKTPESGQTQSPTTAPQTPPDTPPNLASGDAIIVKLEAATGDSWIKYQVDEAPPAQMMLRQGLTQEIPPAQNVVKLNYGNRQTLKLFINNKEAYFPADAQKFKGQVILSRDNLQTFFQPPPGQ